MYQATIQLTNQMLTGTLDFYVLYQVKQELEGIGRKLTIPQLLESVGQEDFQCLFLIFICSIQRTSGLSIAEIKSLYDAHRSQDETDEWILSCLINLYQYIQALFKTCLVMKEQEEESEFEDIPLSSKDDWDFAWLEYQWTSVLKRQGFWSTTPKNFMQQLEAHQQFHGIKKENIEEW